MSYKCPRCGLFSPDEALRCDCGYDFATRSVQSSYLLQHIVKKHGGARNVLRDSSQTYLRNGYVLLGLAAFTGILGYLVYGSLYFFAGAILWGALFLYRGTRLRRLQERLPRESDGDKHVRLH